MNIKDLKQKDSFIYLERWVNLPKYSETAQYSEVNKEYHPRFGKPNFKLPVFNIDINNVEIYKSNPDKKLLVNMIQKDSIKFYLHPDQWEEFKQVKGFKHIKDYLSVSPTSSTRTVLLEEPTRFMIKLHLNKKISRFIRRLKKSSVIHSVSISRECEKIARDKKCPKEFAFLPESLGVVHKELEVGYIIRESVPRPIIKEKRFLVPFFALYSKDQFHPEEPPLLCQMISNQTKQKPLDYFEKHILIPFIKCWAFAFAQYGLLFEAHAQNTLLEIDQNFNPSRIVQRDFQSIPIDPQIRLKMGLPVNFKKHVIGYEDYPRLIEHSLLYDHFVCDYLFKSFAQFFETYYRIDSSEFYSRAKRVFRKFIDSKTEREFFPRGHVTFGEGSKDNIVPLVYLHESPVGRPSY